MKAQFIAEFVAAHIRFNQLITAAVYDDGAVLYAQVSQSTEKAISLAIVEDRNLRIEQVARSQDGQVAVWILRAIPEWIKATTPRESSAHDPVNEVGPPIVSVSDGLEELDRYVRPISEVVDSIRKRMKVQRLNLGNLQVNDCRWNDINTVDGWAAYLRTRNNAADGQHRHGRK